MGKELKNLALGLAAVQALLMIFSIEIVCQN
jgi:hypothetical protein